MTIAWQTPPGSVLAGSLAPLVVSADELAFLTLSFPEADPPIQEEAVYRDGDQPDGGFQGVYRALSTKTGDGPYTYTLRRKGGWPSRPRPYVEEKSLGGGGGAVSWGPVYELDVGAQPTLLFPGAGSYTIDGLTWWVKGSSVVGGGYAGNLQGGYGLIAPSATFSPSGDYNYRSLWFPFAQIATFNPALPYAVAMRFDGYSLPFFRYIVAGLSSLADSAASIPSADRDAQNLLKYDGTSALYHLTGQASSESSSGLSGDVGTHTFYATQLAEIVASSGRRAYTSPPLDPNVHTLSLAVTPKVAAAPSNPGFWFTANGTDVDVWLTHLAVLQPRAA
jgi:hypothetical protein